MRERFTKGEREYLRREERRLLAHIDELPPARRLIAETVARNRRIADAKKAGAPQIGPFFVYDGKLLADPQPTSEVPSIAGFRTSPIDHTEYLRRLKAVGAVPRAAEYDEIPRGRVTYNDAERRYYLFADKCIMKNKRMVQRIMGEFNLPSNNTKIDSDPHYRCPNCISPRRNKKQEEEDWDF